MKERNDTAGDTSDISIAPDRMEDTFQQLVGGLPELDMRQVDSLVASMKLFPASGKRLMMKELVGGKAAAQALAYCTLRAFGDRAVDDLNAVVFNTSASPEAKVRADELLTELGSPIDRDVLEMGVEDPDALRALSPWEALRDLRAGKAEAALIRLRELPPDVCAVLMHCMAQADVDTALPLLDALCDSSAGALAAVSALSQFGGAQSVDLLHRLGRSSDRALQKAARRALHTLRAAGIDVPEDQPEEPAADGSVGDDKAVKAPPVHKCVAVFSANRQAAIVNVARQYPNGRLQVLSAGIDFSKRGIRGARYWLDMSKSRFRKLLDERSGAQPQEAITLEEARRLVARGIRVARVVGTPIPFDLQTGKHVLGDVMAEAAQLETAFRCPVCNAALPEEQVKRIKDAAPYEQLVVETRCEACAATPDQSG